MAGRKGKGRKGSKKKVNSRKTTVKGGKGKASVKRLLSSNNPCCPIINVESRPIWDTHRNAQVGERIKVKAGTVSRNFKDAASASKYIDELSSRLEAKRCKVVTDVKELPGTTRSSAP